VLAQEIVAQPLNQLHFFRLFFFSLKKKKPNNFSIPLEKNTLFFSQQRKKKKEGEEKGGGDTMESPNVSREAQRKMKRTPWTSPRSEGASSKCWPASPWTSSGP
jgi:hypothetical protein